MQRKRDAKGRFVSENVTDDVGLVDRLRQQRDAARAEADLWRLLYDNLCSHVIRYIAVKKSKKLFFRIFNIFRFFKRG